VLVVDDNRDAADITHALVEAWGHAVRVAYDGRSALEIAAEFRPDVVLLDIGLPGMDGYEVAARLRSEAGCATTVLVAFTGYGQEEDRRRVRNAGFDEHLVKPVDPATLEALLQSKAPARAPGTNDQEADRTS
jgi:CheY-like chemotaxis protein